jgi:hypothetical protein
LRRGVVVHAGSVLPAAYETLAEQLAADGPVHVTRVVADWTRPESAGWVPVLRRHGLSMRHHFRTRDTHDPALVALTVEALELVATTAVEHLVLVGDVGAATPLVERLRELGVTVTGVGPPRTPHDFRAACHDFWDLAALEDADGQSRSTGRHRAT